MNKQTLQLVGTVLLVAGLALGSIGTHRIVTNLPISDDEALGFSAEPEFSRHCRQASANEFSEDAS